MSEKEKPIVEEIIENPDGSAKVVMNMSTESQRLLMKEGLKYLIEEMKMTDKVGVFEPPAEFSSEVKTIEMTDEEAQFLLETSVRNALTRGMNKGVKRFDESWDDFFAKESAEDVDDD